MTEMAEFRENRDVRRPFLSTPDARVYFPASTIEKARRAVSRCLRRGEGVALVVGSTGTGKTLLARTLASEFEADNFVSVVSVSRKRDVKSFLQQFMFGLRQSYCGCDETEMRLMALDYLERSQRDKCVLLVDDAQNLSLRVFDEIRALIDQTAGVSKQLSVCLFGSNALEERLNLPALYPFEQRIVARSYLDVFTRDETRKYVDRELSRSKVGATFTKGAKDEIARLSSGVPRVVAQLCDRALFLAFDGEPDVPDDERTNASKRAAKTTSSVSVDISEVERAWNNLQNIPEESEETAPGDVGESSAIEFGELEDEDDDEVASAPTQSDVGASSVEQVSEPSAEKTDGFSEESPELSADEDVKTTTEEPEQSETSDASVVDWETERYGNVETRSTEFQTSPDESVGQTIEEARVVESAPLTPEERRLEAKRAFWDRDESTVFIARLDPYVGEQTEEKFEEQVAENDEEEEEAGKSPLGYEIDEALDARLREKFGFTIDSFESETEDAELNEKDDLQKNAASDSYEVYSDGMKFEVRGASELNDGQKSAPSTEVGGDARSSATSSEVANERFDVPDEDSGYEFDSALEMSAGSSGVAYVDNPRSSTRRPIVDGDDGSREFREFNGFDVEESSARIADDSNVDPRYAAKPEPGETEPSLSDLAYSRIVAATGRGNVGDRKPVEGESSDQYLDELDLLEREIAEEANLIRRIRNIHMQLRAATSSAPIEHPDQDKSDMA